MPYFSHDDIAQLASPPGNSPVGAIRLSGENTFAILRENCRGLEDQLPVPVGRVTHDGDFLLTLPRPGSTNRENIVISCPARFFLMPAPASYTRENVAEIHLPGSPPILNAALAALVRSGARPAAPGEFTFRAFRNGRLTLGQAEAVEELIRADGDTERRRALSRLGDHNLKQIRDWRERLMDIAAMVEASLDFSEEELEESAASDLAQMAAELENAGAVIADNGRDRQENGTPRFALAGLANAGKSSLFNALLGEDAVLVSPEASTTRDRLRRRVESNGISFELCDTPGYDPLNTGSGGMAAAKAFNELGGEDIVFWVVDASCHLGADDAAFAANLCGGVFIVFNKTDLPVRSRVATATRMLPDGQVTCLGTLCVSAATGEGVEDLRRIMAGLAGDLRAPGMWNRRELLELAGARESCRLAATELRGDGRLELASEDLRRGVGCFSRALGEGYAEETLNRIFSRFCIGK